MKAVAALLLCCGLLAPPVAPANDFPTLARVEYVLRCMDARGGHKYENLYSCTCILDKIADGMPYEEYVEADVYTQLWSTPGERGGMFRDPEQARTLKNRLDDLTDNAEQSCVVNALTDIAEKQETPEKDYEDG